jgi:hypothetical protein
MVRTLLIAFVLSSTGCTHDTPEAGERVSSATRPADDQCPLLGPLIDREGWDLAPAGTYRAEQDGEFVIIHVTGETPAGSEVKLFQRPTREWPPTIMLYRKLSKDPVIAVQVGYKTCAKFPAAEPMRAIRIIDSDNKPKEVQVEQPRKGG